MRYAVIDIGTNTFHLVIADVVGNEITEIYRTSIAVKLGEGAMQTHLLTEPSMLRGLNALSQFKALADSYGVLEIHAFATSAVRSSLNGREFVDRAQQLGITIQVISGDTEAEYIFRGVRQGGIITGSSLIIDIGGGSTEFIFCNTQGILWKQSVDIGAARLMQAYFHSDPLSASDASNIQAHLADKLQDVIAAIQRFSPETLIGSAGSFETFAAMIDQPLEELDSQSSVIDFIQYEALAATFIQSTHQERLAMSLLPEVRRDMIVMAALTVNFVLAFTGISTIKISRNDLKMGVLASLGAGNLL